MHTKEWVKASCTLLMVAAFMLQPFVALAQDSKNDEVVDQRHLVEIGPKSSDEVARYTRRVEDSPYLSHAQKLDLLRKRIKYVFVLFQENRSFDFYFGTYPGARGLFSQPARRNSWLCPADRSDRRLGRHHFPLQDSPVRHRPHGKTVLLYPEDTDSVNHGHTAIDAKLDLNTNQRRPE